MKMVSESILLQTSLGWLTYKIIKPPLCSLDLCKKLCPSKKGSQRGPIPVLQACQPTMTVEAQLLACPPEQNTVKCCCLLSGSCHPLCLVLHDSPSPRPSITPAFKPLFIASSTGESDRLNSPVRE